MAYDDEHYRVLGVSRNAGTPEIRRAYRRLARQHHPDTAADPDGPERFRRIAEAYAVLSAPARRTRHDHTTRLPKRRNAAGPEPDVLTQRGVLELSPHEARLAAALPLGLTTTSGLAIVLPAGVGDGDQVLCNGPGGRFLLTVQVNFSPKT